MLILYIWPIKFKVAVKIKCGGHLGYSEISYIWQKAPRALCNTSILTILLPFKTIFVVIFMISPLKFEIFTMGRWHPPPFLTKTSKIYFANSNFLIIQYIHKTNLRMKNDTNYVLFEAKQWSFNAIRGHPTLVGQITLFWLKWPKIVVLCHKV